MKVTELHFYNYGPGIPLGFEQGDDDSRFIYLDDSPIFQMLADQFIRTLAWSMYRMPL